MTIIDANGMSVYLVKTDYMITWATLFFCTLSLGWKGKAQRINCIIYGTRDYSKSAVSKTT